MLMYVWLLHHLTITSKNLYILKLLLFCSEMEDFLINSLVTLSSRAYSIWCSMSISIIIKISYLRTCMPHVFLEIFLENQFIFLSFGTYELNEQTHNIQIRFENQLQYSDILWKSVHQRIKHTHHVNLRLSSVVHLVHLSFLMWSLLHDPKATDAITLITNYGLWIIVYDLLTQQNSKALKF